MEPVWGSGSSLSQSGEGPQLQFTYSSNNLDNHLSTNLLRSSSHHNTIIIAIILILLSNPTTARANEDSPSTEGSAVIKLVDIKKAPRTVLEREIERQEKERDEAIQETKKLRKIKEEISAQKSKIKLTGIDPSTLEKAESDINTVKKILPQLPTIVEQKNFEENKDFKSLRKAISEITDNVRASIFVFSLPDLNEPDMPYSIIRELQIREMMNGGGEVDTTSATYGAQQFTK